jgi:transcriptional regulator with XRE-family HTH domain
MATGGCGETTRGLGDQEKSQSNECGKSHLYFLDNGTNCAHNRSRAAEGDGYNPMTQRVKRRKKSADEVDQYVGRRLRMRRQMLGLSPGGLAKRIGMSRNQLMNYEGGVHCISVSRLQQLADILQVPVPYFFDGSPKSDATRAANAAGPSLDHGSDYVSECLATSDGLALTRALARITDAGLRRQLIRLVVRIASGHRR